jgi:hypothetical protein
MKVLKVAFIIAGRANQAIKRTMRENAATKPVKHPELLDLILIPFPFKRQSGMNLLALTSPISTFPL